MFAHLFGKEISMKGAILGFPDMDVFVLAPVDQDNPESPFAYLQCLEQPEVGFLVTNPFVFHANYEFQLSDQDRSRLQADDPGKIVVLSIVTIANPFFDSTVNLLAPILIQYEAGIGMQTVLAGECNYTTREPLFRRSAKEGGEV